MLLFLFSHILPIFLTINTGGWGEVDKIHILYSFAGRLWGFHAKEGLSWNCEPLLLLCWVSKYRNSRALSCFAHLTQRVWNSPSYPCLVYKKWNDFKTAQRCHRQVGWKAISGEMDMDINILAGRFVIKKKEKETQCYEMQWNIKRGRGRGM